jgi:4-hydroxy-4-methyl-2-oxoglutarate aldolase
MTEWIVRHAPRLSPEIVAAYAGQEASTVYEAAGGVGGMDHTVRPIAWGQHMVGNALTVRCHPADNLMLHAAIAMAQPGDVIVAEVGGLVDAGYWGEITTVAAMARGVVGLVIDGGVRDRAAIVGYGFPIWSRALCMRATVKKTPGAINHPVVVGGVAVYPGDLVLGDDDGVVVVARERVDEVLAASQARADKEAAVMERLRQGELTLDLLGFRQTLTDLGITIDAD